MTRYFLEVAYKGTHYSGFQVQRNANTIQAEVEKAFEILQRKNIVLTGSSRTDAGVHALQNYFHFDFDEPLNPQFLYKINAILPDDIVIKNWYEMSPHAHARFDAISRIYEYRIYQKKNPFLSGVAFYYPFTIDKELMQKAATLVKEQNNFFAFAKTNSQVDHYNCFIYRSEWIFNEGELLYIISGNRFLRGMVRLLTASMLMVGRHKLSIDDFAALFSTIKHKSGHSVAAVGLYLIGVQFPTNYFPR